VENHTIFDPHLYLQEWVKYGDPDMATKNALSIQNSYLQFSAPVYAPVFSSEKFYGINICAKIIF
jgi:hypothetical protein